MRIQCDAVLVAVTLLCAKRCRRINDSDCVAAYTMIRKATKYLLDWSIEGLFLLKAELLHI